ncbi:hypothetical protein [Croceiramulus getboli]|nr:hypothetical protein P8624_11705 [Flavobacteriaceae bacterium YJPT1-3]
MNKSNVSLSGDALKQIKLHYQEEYAKTLKKLKELEQVLQELDPVQLDAAPVTELNTAPSSTADKPKTQKRKYKKKRGRKSVWGKFIMDRLKATQIPLSYDQMTNHAMVVKKLAPSEKDKTKRAISSAAFNLRKNAEKIDTYGIKGSREKYLVLSSWLDDKGQLEDKYKSKIAKTS